MAIDSVVMMIGQIIEKCLLFSNYTTFILVVVLL
jgi:hypothetical protein